MSVEIERIERAEATLGDFSPAFDGAALWHEARSTVQSGNLDDRPLYWRRLKLPDDPVARAESRNYQPSFSDDVDFKILVTGFDPFNLDTHIDQSNPSGVIALSLDQVHHEFGDYSAEIRSLLVPVRFADFDKGLIELLVEPLLAELDLLVTVSMGRDGFDLERFPGLRRSSGKPDNANLLCGGTVQDPIIPPGVEGPEYVEFSLPVPPMLVEGEFLIRDNRNVWTVEDGEIEALSLEALAQKTAVQGSGGGYLSNEISYRTVKLVDGGFPVGHIHTPSITGYDPEMIRAITHQCQQMIFGAIESLTD